ncbi:MAG: phosphate regulon sensor protein PhoR, partial [Gammaproteobacteria bacterium]|nr:phosphate regulon sensor protein PhoR [Gammaproteobacteria bacterium]
MNGLRAELLIVVAAVAALTIVGVMTGQVSTILLIGSFVYLGWHIMQIARLRERMRTGRLHAPYPPGVWRDIYELIGQSQTGERKARKALSRFNARFREAATVFPDALAVVSRSHKLRWCNPSAEKILFGQNFEEIGNQTLQTLLPDALLDQYLTDGRFDQPVVLSPPHDRRRVISIRIMPFGKRKHQLLVVGSDITRVHHLDAARRDFIANVSHELRTPLTVIAGYLDPLTEHLQGDAEWSNSLQLMEQQAQRMGQMIDDLTLLSHLETAEKPLREQRLDIAA